MDVKKIVEQFGQEVLEQYDILNTDLDVSTRELLRLIIDRKIDQEVLVPEFLPVKPVNTLELFVNVLPRRTDRAVEVAEGAAPNLPDNPEAVSVPVKLKKFADVIKITDEMRDRQIEGINTDLTVGALAERIARAEDYEALMALLAAKFDDVAATNPWSSANADPALDIATAIDKIRSNIRLTRSERQNIVVLVPDTIEGYLQRLTEINNVQTTIWDYINKSIGVKIVPHPDITNYALVTVKSPNCGVHFVYRGKLKLVERDRDTISGSDIFVYRKYCVTKIWPKDADEPKSPFVVRITGVKS